MTDAYLLTWNPRRISADDAGLAAPFETFHANDFASDWSVGNRRTLPVGARVYLLRQGVEPRGIVARGEIVGPVFPREHWDGSPRGANYVPLVWDMLSPEVPLVAMARLRAAWPSVCWRPQMSGTTILGRIADEIDVRLFSVHDPARLHV